MITLQQSKIKNGCSKQSHEGITEQRRLSSHDSNRGLSDGIFCNKFSFQKSHSHRRRFKSNVDEIENKLSLVDAGEAWNELRQIQLEKDHPYQAWVDYLTGKYYQFKEKWKQAQVHYTKAIHRFETQSDPDENNLCAACYHELNYVCCR